MASVHTVWYVVDFEILYIIAGETYLVLEWTLVYTRLKIAPHVWEQRYRSTFKLHPTGGIRCLCTYTNDVECGSVCIQE